MKNYEEIKEILLEQGYFPEGTGKEGTGTFTIRHNPNKPNEIIGSIYINHRGIVYEEYNIADCDCKTKLFVSNEIEAFAIVHMLIYVGAIDAKKVFSKQLKELINEPVILSNKG